jgi:CRP/FNR family transcriptional regulator
LFCNEKYNANAVAIEDSVVYFIPKETFINALESNCKLAVNVIQLLAKDLRLAEDHLTERAQKTVRERMANAILFLSETYGFEEDNVTINVALTREEIADLVGTATETTIRLLSELKHEMVIDLVGRKIIILNKAKLYKSANLSTVLNG